MPRLKNLSKFINDSFADPTLINKISVNSQRIALFCNQNDSEALLQALPDVKPALNLNSFNKMKGKIIKNHFKLQASAKQSHKCALSANQIRINQKYIVINRKLLTEDFREQISQQSNKALSRIYQAFNKNHQVGQKLNLVIKKFPFKNIQSPESLNNKWILEDSNQSKQVLQNPYNLLINPTIIYGAEIETCYQECVSFPFIDLMIPRYNKLLIHCFDENFQSEFWYTKGFVSRVIQHQCEHLQGKNILDWRINHGNISINPTALAHFPKSSTVVQDYSKNLKSIILEFPQLIETKEQYFVSPIKLQRLIGQILPLAQKLESSQNPQGVNKNGGQVGKRQKPSIFKKLDYDNLNDNFTINKNIVKDLLPFQDDFVTRIVKHFKKQFTKFDEKVQLGLISFQEITKKQQMIEAPSHASLQYNEEQYSKQIQIKYQSGEKSSTSKLNQKSKTKKRQKTIPFNFEDSEISDEQLAKLMIKHNKQKRK